MLSILVAVSSHVFYSCIFSVFWRLQPFGSCVLLDVEFSSRRRYTYTRGT